MIKRLLFSMLLAVLLSLTGWAQSSLQQGVSQFVQFQNLVESGNLANAYSVLWQSYQNLVAAAKVVKSGTSEYTELRSTLQAMHPLMEKAYLYSVSQRQKTNSVLFAQAYLDIPLMPVMVGVNLERSSNYPLIAYNAAASTYNSGNYQRVIPYFKAYLSSGEQKRRHDVLTFMMDACIKAKDFNSAKEILNEVVTNNPSNVNVLKQAINICMEEKDFVSMQSYLTKALGLQPNSTDLLKLQGRLYEETQEYEKALEVYKKLKVKNPRSLDLAKHIGLCNFNLGVLHHYAADNGNNVKRNQRLSKDYFTTAADMFAEVVAAEPNSLKYTQSLALSYLASEQSDKLEEVNKKVTSLGGVAVNSNTVLTSMTYASQNTQVTAPETPVTPAQVQPKDELPLYSEFAKKYVEERLKKWQAKDPYETAEEYRNRVTEKNRLSKVDDLKKSAEAEYINTYTKDIRFGREMKLRPYDAENKVFLIESKYGELIVPVPRENNEARSFETGWNGMQFSNPQFYISGDKLTLSSLTMTTPAGKTYQFNGDKTLNYVETVVDIKFDKLDNSLFASTNSQEKKESINRTRQTVTIGKSDVDMNIPEVNYKNEKTFAVVICNENYDLVSGVPMAINDGTIFASYCEKTLGLPKQNIRLYKDATYGVMIRAIRDIEAVAEAYQGDVNVIFYYAGHGVPNEQTKNAYLLPVDADGKQTEGCYSLNRLYAQLGSLKANYVLVFLDACFSGATRSDENGGMLMAARGIAIRANDEDPMGNMVIFSAASDDETALPYKEKGHGLFTYYLLKKLQESKGNVTLSELGNYIKTNVKQKSTVVNHKPQTPSVVPSVGIAGNWSEMKIIR